MWVTLVEMPMSRCSFTVFGNKHKLKISFLFRKTTSKPEVLWNKRRKIADTGLQLIESYFNKIKWHSEMTIQTPTKITSDNLLGQ